LSLEVPAGEPFTITLKNQDDPGVTHDVDIRTNDKKTVVADQTPTDGGQTSDYLYPALKAGHYVFACSVHPFMIRELTVE
jgi:plastocyanin